MNIVGPCSALALIASLSAPAHQPADDAPWATAAEHSCCVEPEDAVSQAELTELEQAELMAAQVRASDHCEEPGEFEGECTEPVEVEHAVYATLDGDHVDAWEVTAVCPTSEFGHWCREMTIEHDDDLIGVEVDLDGALEFADDVDYAQPTVSDLVGGVADVFVAAAPAADPEFVTRMQVDAVHAWVREGSQT